MSVEIRHQDCMEYMAGLADGAFDLAIVDPPYGIGASAGVGKYGRLKYQASDKAWDTETPPAEYFDGLRRVSSNQIIWGGNYFALPQSRGWAVWDKAEGFAGRDFSEGELAWTSFDTVLRIFKRDPLAMRDYQDKIHPTQKPVALYRWLLHNYAKPGWRILDTHLGSGSSAIAAHEMGFDFVGIEIDEEYVTAARKRFDLMTRQISLDL